MSVFSSHASVSEGGDFAVAPMGVYVCNLVAVDVVNGPKYDNPSEMEDRFKFVFRTATDTDDDGNPFQFVKFTGTRYGNEKAALTILLESMMGRPLADGELDGLDTKLMRHQWRVAVDESKNGAGKDINKITGVRPVAPNQGQRPQQRRPSPPPDNSDIEDPFAE